MTTNTNVNLNYNSGSPTFSPGGPYNLSNNDSITVELSGFPSGSSIARIDFYDSADESGEGNVGHWTPPSSYTNAGSYKLSDIYSMTPDPTTSPTAVEIKDVEGNSTTHEYWFKITVNGPGGPWIGDPEMINEGGG